MAFFSVHDSLDLLSPLNVSLVGELLRPALPFVDDSEPSPPLLCRLLLLLPDADAVLPMECLFLSFELALCRSWSLGSTLRLLWLGFLASPEYG